MPINMNSFKNTIKMIETMGNGNPRDFVMTILKQQAETNPMARNLMQLAEQNNSEEIEKIVRNIAKEKGIDYDKDFNTFKETFRF